MSIALLDVNVLIALFDREHINHKEAHRWFAGHRKDGWATCPVTENGFVRILSNAAYPTVRATPSEVISHLQQFCASEGHHFWSDSASLRDEDTFRTEAIIGSKGITDTYLLGLAVKNHGRLVTFDGSIRVQPVIRASARHLLVLPTS